MIPATGNCKSGDFTPAVLTLLGLYSAEFPPIFDTCDHFFFFGFCSLYATAGMVRPAQHLQAVKAAHTFQSMRRLFPGHLHLPEGI